MNKMTPMILVMLMLTSVLASIDYAELQETKEIEETSGRAEADAAVAVITSPRETTCTSSGSCLNEILSGNPVNFKAYLKNSGDADLTDMSYKVEVYAETNGVKGQIAQDEFGNDLSWSNDFAVCTTTQFITCDEASVAPGDFVGGGELTLSVSGTPIVWDPAAGNYIVIVSVSSDNSMGDPGNDELGVKVTVRDYHDVAVDLSWIDSSGNELGSTVEGDDTKNFKVSVSLESPGMSNMTIRNATVEMTYTGVDSGDSSSFVVGVNSTVDTYEEFENGVKETGWAYVVGDAGNFNSHVGQVVGQIIPTSSSSQSVYEVTATLLEYTIYDAHVSCGSDVFTTISCEETFDSTNWGDEYSGSNTDSIKGSVDSFHDASLYGFQIISMNAAEETYEYYGGIGVDITSTLSPGEYILYSEVGYDSSSLNFLYDWNMSYTVTDSIGSSYYYTNNCTDMQVQHTYKYLGQATQKTDADLLGEACVTITLGEGEYSIEAEANILGQWLETTDTLDDKVEDMSLSNNRYTHDVTVENFAPQILTLTSSLKDAVYSDERPTDLVMSADTFDVEGDTLAFLWTDSDGNDIACQSSNSPNECTIPLAESMVPNFEFNLEVQDTLGASDFASSVLNVMNDETFSSTGLENGLEVDYGIVYMSTGLTVDFNNVSTVSDEVLPNFGGTYSSVAAFSVSTSTTFGSDKVDSQTLDVNFPNDLGATSIWIKVGNLWQLLSDSAPVETDVGGVSSYSYTWGSGTEMLGIGTEVHLFGGVLSQDAAPEANITGFVASAEKAGGISINWMIDGTMLPDEKVLVHVCETEANCASPVSLGSFDSTETDTLYSGTNTVHGTTYHITAAVCKSGLCSNEASASVVADKVVDPSVTAEDLTIAESGETWAVNWNASAQSDDVASWLVCYNKASFTANEMFAMIGTDKCVATSTTDATINMYTSAGTYDVHFVAVPVDVVGNTATAASSTFIEYSRADDTSNVDDGSQTTETEASSGVPTWTWGVIGVVVVAAFVVGAFILSRGDDGDDENKEWDY